MKFDELNIDERILRAIEDMGFEETSPIQTQAIPAVCEGIDVVGQAQTGTGKTAAYTIPMLMKIDPQIKKPQAIVLCPTRELAVQVAEEIRKLAKYMSDIKVLPVYGGQEIVRQIKSLKTGVQIIVGTPGRVMDHMRRKTVKFDNINMVILDEADEMLDKGRYGNNSYRNARRQTDSNVLSYYAKGYYGYCKKLPERCQDYKGSKKRTYSI